MLLAGLLVAGQQVGPSDYEGLARDSFAAWSMSWSLGVKGQTRTLSVMALYDTPTPFNGNPTPVVYSIHPVQLDCAAKTVTWLGGGNYTASGALISPATPTGPMPWTDGTTGFQSLASQVCAITQSQ